MLETIQKLEGELAEKVATAKHEAAVAIQTARTQAADSRTRLEERLRAEEKQAQSAAEERATKEAATIIATTEAAVQVPPAAKVKDIATKHLTSLISI